MFHFDMAFSVDQLVDGLRAILAKHGHSWVEARGQDGVTFAVELSSSGRLRLEIRALPVIGHAPTPFRTRSLLEAHPETATDREMETMRRAVMLGFLRVMG